MEFGLPPGSTCVITDDGTLLAIELALLLHRRGWPVTVLRLPSVAAGARPPLPADITTREPAGMAGQPVAIFIHLHPPFRDEVFSAEEKAVVKQVFFLAGELKQPLHQAAAHGRSGFITVTRLDGQLGLGGGSFGAIGGGLFGLTKTLAQEWPDVFCRAVDLSPDLPADRAAEAILAELFDPNRLIVETGWDGQQRVTLKA